MIFLQGFVKFYQGISEKCVGKTFDGRKKERIIIIIIIRIIIRNGAKHNCLGAIIKKGCYTDLLHFSTRKHNLVFFPRPNHILTVELHRSFLYILFSGENAK